MSERSLALAPSAAAALAVEGDILDGGEGDDRLFAAAGSQLIGGIGNDVLVAGDGAQLTGGAGFDTFVLDWLSGDAVITDFSTAGGDVVDLGTTLDAAQSDDEGLNPFATGHLRMVARDGGTAIVFDRDGAGSGAAAEIGFVAGTTVAEVGEALVASGSPETRLDPTRTSFIAGSDEDDEIDGTAAGDTVSTRYGNDVVRGHGGDDELAGGWGNDRLEGGAGADKAVYSNARAGYAVTELEDGRIQITDIGQWPVDGTDIVSGVEVFVFADRSYSLAELLGGEPENAAPDALVIDDASVAENASAGALVGTVSGHDPDGDVLAYSLLSDAGGRFVIDAATGALTTTLTLATTPSIFWRPARACARALPTPSSTSTAVVALAVTGVADGQAIDGTKKRDTLTGSEGEDVIKGGKGKDVLSGLGGADELWGGKSKDRLSGGEGVDELYGESSKDVLDGGAGDDLLDGGSSNDVLAGGEGHDVLKGGDGKDRLDGGAGDDRLEGGSGKDELAGGEGADTLIGGADDDRLAGGAGADLFVFGRQGGRDVVADFLVGTDSLRLEDGLTITGQSHRDTDRDGRIDTILSLSDGAQIILLGVAEYTG